VSLKPVYGNLQTCLWQFTVQTGNSTFYDTVYDVLPTSVDIAPHSWLALIITNAHEQQQKAGGSCRN